MSINPNQVKQLKEFISICKANPGVLYTKELAFFKEWLLSMNATIPGPIPPPSKNGHAPAGGTEDMPEVSPSEEDEGDPEDEDIKPTSTSSGDDKKEPAEEPMEEEEEEEVESDLELDTEGTIPPDDDLSQAMGDISLDITEEMRDKAQEERMQGSMALSEGNLEKAMLHFTEAILSNPKSAPLYAKRASVFIKLEKPNAAIKDCNEAVKLNQDSAQGFKWRGRAYQLLGKWEEAAKDLQTASKLDFDEDVTIWLKDIKPKAERIREHNLKRERRGREKEAKERKRKVKEALEREREEREEEKMRESMKGMGGMGGMPGMGGMGGMPGMGGMGGMPGMPGGMGGMPGGMGGMPGGMGGMPGGMGGMPGGMGGMPGGMGGMPGGMGGAAGGGMPGMGGVDPSSILQDPELLAMFQEPEVMMAFKDIQSNPANIGKYKDNPKIAKVMEKLNSKFGTKM